MKGGLGMQAISEKCLKHYGKKGMQWGRRKSSTDLKKSNGKSVNKDVGRIIGMFGIAHFGGSLLIQTGHITAGALLNKYGKMYATADAVLTIADRVVENRKRKD